MNNMEENGKEKLIIDMYSNWDYILQKFYYRVNDRSTAEDMRMGLLDQLSRRKHVNYDGRFKPFITAVIANFSIDYFRLKSQRIAFNSIDIYTFENVILNHRDLTTLQDHSDTLYRCKKEVYSKFSKNARKVFYYTIQGYKQREIALIMSIPEGTVKTYIYKVAQHFKKKKDQFV